MALIAFNSNTYREYSLKEDTSDTPTLFKLGLFDSFVRIKIESILTSKNLMDESDATYLLEVLRYGLKGWTNFKDEDGKDIEFKTIKVNIPKVGEREIVADECLLKLKLEWISELVLEIYSDNFTDSKKK